jgi:hypothetical protein
MAEENKLYTEYEKFLKQDVVVKYHEGNQVAELEGNLRFLSFNYLSCVIMTKTEKIIVKNIITISRKRKQGK